MAFLSYRVSGGKKYWSICESRRINGKPRNIIIKYLGTGETLLKKITNNEKISVKTYNHGDIVALLNSVVELDIINIINKYIPLNKRKERPMRDGLTVGASLVLAAIGRASHPTSKKGWYEWCKSSSLEYCLGYSFKKIDSQHFWDQMDNLPIEAIERIEEDILKKIIDIYKIDMSFLFYDTTNFFTFIDSSNKKNELAKRGKNKQKRYDLRQIGMSLMVTKEEQFPIFHKTYEGNKNDVTIFKEVIGNVIKRLKRITKELSDITIIFDRGNNSKDNFIKIDKEEELYYVGGLVSSYFKDLIKESKDKFTTIKIRNETIPVYRTEREIWGKERTCIVVESKQLKEGQIRGIYQHLEKKYKILQEFKNRLEDDNKRKKRYSKEDIENRLNKIIKGQFIKDILKYEIIEKNKDVYSFTYYIDNNIFSKLKEEILGMRILVTNRHKWSNKDILLAYNGQSNVENAFKNLKNPFHLAVRPQYHWTDQKIEVHLFICIISYILTIASYTKIKRETGYKRNVNNFIEDLQKIRLACVIRGKKKKVEFQLEEIPKELKKMTEVLNITNGNLHPKINISGYN